MGFPKFKKNCRSVEYKQTGWQLDLKTRQAIISCPAEHYTHLLEVGSREWGVGCRSKEIQFINFLLLMIPHDPDLI
jgi:hypothetical protein